MTNPEASLQSGGAFGRSSETPATALGALKRKIATGWLQLFSGSILASLLNFVSFIVMTRTLSVDQVGLIAIIQTYWRLLEGFLSFQSFTTLISYGAAAIADSKTRDFQHIVRTCVTADVSVTIAAAIAGIGGLALFATALNIPPDFVGFAMVGAVMLLHMMTCAPSGVLRLFDRFYLVAAADVVIAVIRLMCAAVGFALGLSAVYFLLAWFAAQLVGDVLLIALGFLTLKQKGYAGWLTAAEPFAGRTRGLVHSLVAFNFSSMINILSEEGDVLLVNALMGPAGAGRYRIAKNFASIIHRLSGPLHNVIYPEISRLVATADKGVFLKLVRDINIGCGLIALSALAMWSVFGQIILRYSVGSEYLDTYSTVIIFLIAIVTVFFGFTCWPILQALQKWREIFLVMLAATMTYFGVALLLIPRYGINGAAAAQVVCYGMEVGLALIFIRRAIATRSWHKAA